MPPCRFALALLPLLLGCVSPAEEASERPDTTPLALLDPPAQVGGQWSTVGEPSGTTWFIGLPKHGESLAMTTTPELEHRLFVGSPLGLRFKWSWTLDSGVVRTLVENLPGEDYSREIDRDHLGRTVAAPHGGRFPTGSEEERYSLGTSLAVIDDLDGDGISEVLAGEPDYYDPSAFLFSGADGSIFGVVSPAANRFDQDAWGTRFGYDAAGLGDLDGDGLGEFAVTDRGTHPMPSR